jgi:hypothetical protein
VQSPPTFRTLADVRGLIGQLPADRRERKSWRQVAAERDKAAAAADPRDVSVALWLALTIARYHARVPRSPWAVCLWAAKAWARAGSTPLTIEEQMDFVTVAV